MTGTATGAHVTAPVLSALSPPNTPTPLSNNRAFAAAEKSAREGLKLDKTEKWINKYFPNIFEEIYFANKNFNNGDISKSDVCIDLGIDILIFLFIFGRYGNVPIDL